MYVSKTTVVTANRYHDISCGHRVVGHENKCAHLHGHNYRIHFDVAPAYTNGSIAPVDNLDNLGRVLDFGVIKAVLCEWLEKNWDHKMLLWIDDPMFETLSKLDYYGVVGVPFNPTAENMGVHLMECVAPELLKEYNCTLVKCTIEETRKCSVTVSKQ